MSSAAINYQSLEWMPKSVWGPIKWKELHCRALMDLPLEEEDQWFRSFVQGLPCSKCRAHFEEFLKDNPPDLQTRADFFAWTVAAHNYVNQACGKKTVTVEEARGMHCCAEADG